jgi:hypothetical protein
MPREPGIDEFASELTARPLLLLAGVIAISAVSGLTMLAMTFVVERHFPFARMLLVVYSFFLIGHGLGAAGLVGIHWCGAYSDLPIGIIVVVACSNLTAGIAGLVSTNGLSKVFRKAQRPAG